YFFESEAAPLGKELVEQHPEVFSLSDGAWVFKGEEHGLHTRVFLNSEGLPTYEAKELALAKMKDDRFGGYDHSVVSTANEITEYFKVLLCAMGFIYPELAKKTEHIGHGTVRLSSGKMSSRTGDVIAALDFIQEITEAAASRIASSSPELAKDQELAEAIALGAIKYATLKGNILQDSVFNKEEALSFEGASGPYLQYTHARLTSVIEKAKTAGVTMGSGVPDVPYQVERILYRFEEAVAEAARTRAPHLITQYLTELAGTFNTFYAAEKIADQADRYAPYKLALAEATKQTLKNGLWLLGIKAPERM
ncbi:MAG: arginine--tRNA ligase, partial [Candidatus Paceibacterota bacterium]